MTAQWFSVFVHVVLVIVGVIAGYRFVRMIEAPRVLGGDDDAEGFEPSLPRAADDETRPS